MDVRPGLVVASYYELGEQLGEGGMGIVYYCRHRETKQDYAIKLLRRDLANYEEQATYFLREAKALQKFDHPHVLSVVAYGIEEDQPYLITELCRGPDGQPATLANLAARSPDQRLKIDDVGEIFGQLFDAAAYLHDNGIIHRDIKPENVFLQEVDGVRCVKLADFGLAAFSGADEMVDRATMSLSLNRQERAGMGALIGTYAYMSPEQKDGLLLDARSDVYALGLMLFRLTTGVDQVSFRLPSEMRPGLPKWVDEVVGVSVDIDREERVDNARSLLGLIKPSLEARAVSSAETQKVAVPPPLPTLESEEISSAPVPRIPASQLLLVAVVAAVLLVVGWLSLRVIIREDKRVAVPAPATGVVSEVQEKPKRAIVQPPKKIPPTKAAVVPRKGPVNYALYFNEDLSEANGVEVPTLKDGGESISFEVWVKPASAAKNVSPSGSIRSHLYLLGFGRLYRIGTSSVGTVDFRYSVDPKGRGGAPLSIYRAKAGPNIMDAPEATHLAAVRDGSRGELRFYVDGALVGRKPYKRTPGSGTLEICSDGRQWNWGSGLRYVGWMDEVRISDYPRYNADFSPQRRFELDAHTTALYHFDSGQGRVLRDSSGNGHHGIIWGARWVQLDGSRATAITDSRPGAAEDYGELLIHRAVWGLGDRQADVTAKVQELVHEGALVVTPLTKVFGDPYPNHGKNLHVDYTLDGVRTTKKIWQGGLLALRTEENIQELRRLHGDDFVVLNATWGKDYRVQDVTELVAGYVKEKRMLELRVTRQWMKRDPAPNTSKYLILEYWADGHVVKRRFAQNSTVKLP